MSNYQFAPSPDINAKEPTHVFWENGFTSGDIDQIREVGDKLPMAEGVIGWEGEAKVNQKIRKSRTGWMTYQHCPVAYDKLAYIARQLNGQYFDFDIYGFVEDFQYTVYSADNEHYDWHMDRGGGASCSPRKLSLVLQLSDPSEYEGGDLEFMVGGQPAFAKKEKGIVYAFPSFVMHRVTPVTSGVRRTLVVWTSGPRFR
jgi:PKHD-type hydroxylase